MKDAQKPDHISLNTLINRVREGRFVIPDFQRDFEWEPWDIKELMRSIFLDYYIGSLLLWKGKTENFDALSCQDVYGFSGTGKPEYIVLDGQQRLTAIHYAFLAPDFPLPNRANFAFYYIQLDAFADEEYDKAFHYEWRTRWWDRVFQEPELQFVHHIFPLSLVGSGGFRLLRWIEDYRSFWLSRASGFEASGDSESAATARRHADSAMPFGEAVNSIGEQYQISYVELDQELELEKVCDIFTKLNSIGVRLDVFDLMNALLRPKGLPLKQRWRDASKRLSFVEGDRMNVYILQVMSILLQAYCSPKYLYFMLPGQEKPIRLPDGTRTTQVLVHDVAEFEHHWNEAVTALETATELLRHPHEFGATKSDYLPYVSILPAFASLQAYARTLPAMQRLTAQTKIRHWYWASVFTNRYSGSVESTSTRDYLDMQTWIADDAAEPSLLGEFKAQFRNLGLRNQVRRGTSIYNGVFNLLVLNQARDWITGNVPQPDDLDDHHIVPVKWCVDNLPPQAGNTILNRSPLTSDTNRNVIRDRLPNQYLPELIAANGEETVRSILNSHLISPVAQQILLRDPFTPADFEEFINERQRTIQEAIENLLIKERLDLEPRLRELDEQIERIELGLRELVYTGLHGDFNQVPSGIASKVEERLQGSMKKSGAVEGAQVDPFKLRLEFFDLRDLQSVITNKGLWQRFANRFVSPVVLDGRFDQLSELRNCIRHLRNVNDVTRKDGEAAILWFEQVLQK